jgi:hypothetical protein
MRTPEEIFRTEQKDLYVICFKEREFEKDQKEVMQWLDAHVPDSPYEFLAPSEALNYLCGYFGDLRIVFTEADLLTYCEHWETPEGKCKDPRFQCFIKPYQKWFDEISQYAPQRAKPQGIGLAIWWNTPMGFIYHQINQELANERKLIRHPLQPHDLWFLAVRAWPELASLNPDELIYGDNSFNAKNVPFIFYFEGKRPAEVDFPIERQKALLAWFNLPPASKVALSEW